MIPNQRKKMYEEQEKHNTKVEITKSKKNKIIILHKRKAHNVLVERG